MPESVDASPRLPHPLPSGTSVLAARSRLSSATALSLRCLGMAAKRPSFPTGKRRLCALLFSAAFRLTHACDSMLHVSGLRSFRLPAGSPTAPTSARTQTVRCVFYAWMEARARRIQMARIELKVRGSCLLCCSLSRPTRRADAIGRVVEQSGAAIDGGLLPLH